MGRDNSSGFYSKGIREPEITSTYYINLRNLSKLLRQTVRYSVTQGKSGFILDLGCGEKPYQPFFVQKYDQYVGVDIKRNSLADVIAYGEYLPFRDDSFGVCLCTEAYEHVDDPYEVTGEVSRVLKKGGVLILSGPGVMRVHNYPNDYWRWTDQGFRRMLSKYFSNIEVQEVTTPLETFFQIALIYLPTSKFSSLSKAFVNKLVGFLGKNPLNKRLPELISIYLVVAKKGERSPT